MLPDYKMFEEICEIQNFCLEKRCWLILGSQSCFYGLKVLEIDDHAEHYHYAQANHDDSNDSGRRIHRLKSA
jgi:hypothetical protein